jgi:hypothetical protein
MDNTRINYAKLRSKLDEVLKLLSMIDTSIMTKSNLKMLYKAVLNSLFIFKLVSVKNLNILDFLVKSLYYSFNLLFKNIYSIQDPLSVTKKLDSVIFYLKLLVYSSVETDSGVNIEVNKDEIIINDTIRYY